MKGLHDRISQAHARFSDVEQRLDHLEHGQSCLLELRKRCESLHARQTAILSPLDILQGIQHQVIAVPAYYCSVSFADGDKMRSVDRHPPLNRVSRVLQHMGQMVTCYPLQKPGLLRS